MRVLIDDKRPNGWFIRVTKGQKKYKVATIKNELGLHARSAAQIARIAGRSSSNVWLKKDDKMADLYILAGASFQKLKIYPKALELLHKARELKPRQFNIYSYLGNTYLRMDSLPQALMSHKMSVKLNPNNAACYFNTAHVFLETNQFDSAQIYVNSGLKINPNYPGAGGYLQRIKQGLAEQGY